MISADDYVARVLERMPPNMPERTQIALELRGHIDERLAQGLSLEAVLDQLGPADKLAESYLSAIPLHAVPASDRLLAKAIDAAVALVLLSPLLALCAWLVPNDAVPVLIVLTIVGLGFVLCVYTAIAEAMTGQTLGKRLLSCRVVRENGGRIGAGQAAVRQLPIVFQMFWIDALFALFTDRSQRAFELLSKTRVVRNQEVRS